MPENKGGKHETLQDKDVATLKKIIISLLLLVGLLAAGTFLFFRQTGNLPQSLLKAVKLVLHVDPGSGGAVMFLLSVAGAIISIYVIMVIINIFYTDKLKKSIEEARLLKKISKLKDHYIICGGGSLGFSVGRALVKKGMSVVAIEADNERVSELNNAGILAFEGDCFEKSYLEKVQIKKAKMVIACLNDDGDNLLVTLLVKEMNPDVRVIAEATFEKYITQLKRAGADQVIVPREISGIYIAKVAAAGAAKDTSGVPSV